VLLAAARAGDWHIGTVIGPRAGRDLGVKHSAILQKGLLENKKPRLHGLKKKLLRRRFFAHKRAILQNFNE
jgi:hypothetical protein